MTLTASLCALVVLAGSADALVTKKLDRISLQVPGVWKATMAEGTRKWEAPSKDAQFSLDVFKVEGKALAPKACLDKLTRALGAEGWEVLEVGGAPAAKRTFTDTLEDGKTRILTHSYVGCDGRTKWGMTFVFTEKKAERFEKLAREVTGSLRYTAK